MSMLTRTRSEELFARSLKVLPGGNTRTTTYYPPFPLVVDSGEGCHVVDVDGHRYIDLLNNYTSLIHGHAHPLITEAVGRALRGGTVFPSPVESQLELAERIVERFPSIDLVRFTNSGTEAVMCAVRAARAFTGRDLIVQARGSYHGSWEQVSFLDESPEGGTRGIPGVVRQLVRSVSYNDISSLEGTMAVDGPRVAAILLEPVLGQTIQEGSREFLHAAQELAARHDALLILDEVVTARLSTAGRQGQLDLTPDLTTLGKVIGGGLPVGAFGGRADIMAMFDPRADSSLSHHGTFNGNNLTMEAGKVSLDLLTAEEIERIDGLAHLLQAHLEDTIWSLGFPATVRRAGSILGLDSPLLKAVHGAALAQGVMMAPRGQLSISTPMTESVVQEAAERIAAALRSARQEN